MCDCGVDNAELFNTVLTEDIFVSAVEDSSQT